MNVCLSLQHLEPVCLICSIGAQQFFQRAHELMCISTSFVCYLWLISIIELTLFCVYWYFSYITWISMSGFAYEIVNTVAAKAVRLKQIMQKFMIFRFQRSVFIFSYQILEIIKNIWNIKKHFKWFKCNVDECIYSEIYISIKFSLFKIRLNRIS